MLKSDEIIAYNIGLDLIKYNCTLDLEPRLEAELEAEPNLRLASNSIEDGTNGAQAKQKGGFVSFAGTSDE